MFVVQTLHMEGYNLIPISRNVTYINQNSNLYLGNLASFYFNTEIKIKRRLNKVPTVKACFLVESHPVLISSTGFIYYM